MAAELQVAFPQFSLESITRVIEVERTSDASAMKLMELDDERNKLLAEQYHATTRRRMEKAQVSKGSALGSPPVYSKQPDANINIVESKPEAQTLTPHMPPAAEVIKTPTPKLASPNIPTSTIVEERPAHAYTDLSSPAVDRLLRGFGGREKKAPVKNTEYSIPSSNVEEGLKENIKTTDAPPQQSTPDHDLAARKEARRKARRERRERQQQHREALTKATVVQTRRGRRSGGAKGEDQAEVHLTHHSNKGKLLPSLSTPAINTLEDDSNADTFKVPPSRTDELNDDITSSMISIAEESDNKMQSSRHAASSGYDTGSEWYLDTLKDGQPDTRPKRTQAGNVGHDEEEASETDSSNASRRCVKYKCGTKYEAANKSGRHKPSKYDSKKSKKYSNRRKTLTFDHYSTDHQDRSSL